ncbi:ferritin-like domain-containing protein [Arhodomonas sp. SL1]|uniref:ferritin-like domain-containing protein n=1 Tax=Arhodomonas sp. SL1 TaxID=3425691 RepID=UPI003F88137C
MTEGQTHGFDALPPIDNVNDLFRVAVAMEEEAARRYDDLAQRMESAGQPELATLFRELEAQEREHETGIEGWARSQGIDATERPTFQWQSPESLTEEEIAEAGGEAVMTPEGALNLAVHNEERAFSFYVRIATEAEDREVREYAERMAGEEINHVALLRLERRRAARRRMQAEQGPRAFDDEDTLRQWLDEREREQYGRLAAIAESCRRLGLGDACAGLADEATHPQGRVPADRDALLAEVRDALRETEGTYETLLRTSEEAESEQLVTLAQLAAERVLERLARLSDLRATIADGGATGT